MDQLRQQVARARRRLSTELFLHRLVTCLVAGLAAAAAAIAVPKIVVVENLPANWAVLWLAGGVVGAVLAALAWTWLRGRSDLEAAIEIDQRFDLRERVASSLSLTPEMLDTPAGQALLADALRAVKRIDVDERFKIRPQRRAWLPVVPAAIAFVLTMFVANREAESTTPGNTLTQEQKDTTAAALRERLKKRQEEAAKAGLKDAEELFKQLEKKTEELTTTEELDRKQALVKLNDLAKELQKRREELGGDSELRKQLAGMKDMAKGPAEKMMEAMKDGDWQKAKQELDKLKEQLKDGKLDAKSKEQLEKQLEQLGDKLNDAAQKRQQAMDQLKKQIEQAKQQGNMQKAGQLQQKLDQMAQQQAAAQQMQQMAQQLQQAKEALKQGDQQAAAQALDQMMQQMEQMQQQMAEGQMLDQAMDQLQMAKDAMGCQQCQGEGCQACNGGAGNKFSEKGGNGMGAGRGGFGDRPDEENDVDFRDTQVRQKPGQGAAVVVGEADGPNIRGQVLESVKEEMTSQASEPADPLVIERLPKSRLEHTQEYFDMLREGE
ncbi:MAG: hypothetical protein CMJ58_16035 [Planctomycetaceae bacterium]|nr:hypothetical protein [Planctomycetaceae bacterium]